MPYYCETALNTLGTFPAEPVNTYTSFAPVLFGILALAYLIRGRHTDRVAWTLAILTILTGLGSVAWHSMRTEFTLLIDWLPGAIYFVIVAVFWAMNVGGRYVGIVLLVALSALAFLVPFHIIQSYRVVIFSAIILIAVALVVATWVNRRPAFAWTATMIGAAMVALTFRTLDLNVCDTIPVGTHFFWHIFLGLAAYAGVRMMVLVRARPARG